MTEKITLQYKHRTILRNRIDEIKPLLQLDGEWTHADVEGMHRYAIIMLSRTGAIEKVDTRLVERQTPSREDRNVDKTNMHVWEWDEQIKNWLISYYSEQDKLPCDHRAHVCNPRDMDGYSCQYCREDEDREMPVFDKQTVKNCL